METKKVGRLLFGAAAIYNIVGAAVLALMPQALEVALRMPTGAVNTVYGQCFIAFILVFAGMYWCVSRDHAKYRPFIAVGAIGKVAVVSIVVWHWLSGEIGPALAGMVVGDLFFAVAFCHYLLPHKVEAKAPSVGSIQRILGGEFNKGQ